MEGRALDGVLRHLATAADKNTKRSWLAEPGRLELVRLPGVVSHLSWPSRPDASCIVGAEGQFLQRELEVFFAIVFDYPDTKCICSSEDARNMNNLTPTLRFALLLSLPVIRPQAGEARQGVCIRQRVIPLPLAR